MKSNNVPRDQDDSVEGKASPGMRIADLPEDVAQQLLKGIFSTQAQWAVFEGFASADPGRKIALLRAASSPEPLTQAGLAAKAGLRQKDVSMAEKHFDECVKTRSDIIEKIVSVLNISLVDLLFDGSSSDSMAVMKDTIHHARG